jgi:gentisate 1,2-dioxygenase
MAKATEWAGQFVGAEDAFRRDVAYKHPEIKDQRTGGGICHTFSIGVQYVKPGELPPAHRHLFGAMRFVLQGQDAGTVVDGEAFPMEPGDLITTPAQTWHDHYNQSDRPILWLDIVDASISGFFQVLHSQLFPKPVQDHIRPVGMSGAEFGGTRPVWAKGNRNGQPPAMRYAWSDTRRALELLAEEEGDPFDGITVRYANPLNGSHTIPTLAAEMTMVRPGEKLKPHRHTATVAYHAFRGSGRTIIEDQVFEWNQGDTFVVPLWCAHHHENLTGESAYLFSISDRGALDALGLYEEEPA